MFELPDCKEYDYQIKLSPYLERELILKIAENGMEGIDEFISEQAKRDKEIVKNLQKLRAILKQQAEKIIVRKKEEFKKLEMKSKEKLFHEYSILDEKRKKIEGRYAKSDSIPVERIISADDLVKLIIDQSREEIKLNFFQKLKKFFLKIISIIINFFKNIFAKLKRKKKEKFNKDIDAFFSSPQFGNIFYDIDAQIKNAMKSKEFSSYINKEMRGRKRWLYHIDEKAYLEEAKNILKEHVEEKIKEERRKLEKEKEEYKKELEEIEKEKEIREKEEEEELKRLKKLYEKEKELIIKKAEEKPDEILKESILENLKKSNYIREKEEKLVITSNLIDRFAEIILATELHELPSSYQTRFGTSAKNEGIYEKDKMQSVYEISRMDILDSMIQSRITHPDDKHIYDEDIIVYRELLGMTLHVVIMFDKSYSMEENNRILAAKRAVLALYKAVKKQNQKNIIDLIGFDTNVDLMGLVDVWKAEPKGFTNIAGAIRIADKLFNESKADNKLIYLITDGLPEAYTDSNGNNVIAEPDISLRYAISEAKKLEGKLTLILLEPKDNLYVESAKKIVNSAKNGKLIVTDPNELAKEMLVDYIKDTL